MRKFCRVLAVLISLIFVVGLLTTKFTDNVSADSDYSDRIYYFNENDWGGPYYTLSYTNTGATLYIGGYGSIPNSPSYVFDYSTIFSIDRIIIEDGIGSIGSEAFRGFSDLQTIVIPDSVTYIGDSAFEGCNQLKTLRIPSNIQYLGDNLVDRYYYLDQVFVACNVNSEIYYKTNMLARSREEYHEFSSTTHYCTVCGRSSESIADYYSGNYYLLTDEDYDGINESLTIFSASYSGGVIERPIRYTCGPDDYRYVKNIVFDSGITSIPDDFFAGWEYAENVEYIRLPDTLITIGDHAFIDCDSLTTIEIPNSVTSMGFGVFDGCSSLTEIRLSDNLQYGPSSLYDLLGSGLYSLETIITACNPNPYVTQIMSETYMWVKNHQYDRYSSNSNICTICGFNRVTEPRRCGDGVWARFSDETCTELIIYGHGSMGDFGYYGVYAYFSDLCHYNMIQRIVIEEGVTGISDNAFSRMNYLETIEIPDSIQYVSRYCFGGYSYSPVEVHISCHVSSTPLQELRQVVDDRYLIINHPNEVLIDAVEATCRNSGSTAGARCLDCGEITGCEYIPQTSHRYVLDPVVPATCTTVGFTEGAHCSTCDWVYPQEEIPATGHTYVTDPMVPATCITTGLTAGSHCSVCGEVLIAQQEIPVTEHTYVLDPIVPATCTTNGRTAGNHCSVCGYVLVAQQDIPMTGHVYDDDDDIICNSCGESRIPYDGRCGQRVYYRYTDETQTELVIFGEGSMSNYYSSPSPFNTETVQSIIVEDGVTSIGNYAFFNFGNLSSIELPDSLSYIREGSFNNCDSLTSIEIPDSVWSIASNAFWDCDSLNSIVISCRLSSSVIRGLSDYDSILNIVHSNEESVDAVQATCTVPGSTAGVICSGCGDTITAREVIPATGHTEAVVEAVEATCTTAGLTEGSHCSVCGEVIVAQEVIPATGHTYVTDPMVPATETSTGLTAGFHCSECGEVVIAQQEIPMIVHTHTEEAVAEVTATCTTEGTTAGVICSECGDIISGCEVIEATGHTYVTDPMVPATETTTGLTAGFHCSECGEVFIAQQEIPMLVHVHTEEAVAEVPATCTTEGTTAGVICSECGEIISGFEVIPATGHTEVVDEAVEATVTSTGLTAGSHCSVCGVVIVAQEEVPQLIVTGWVNIDGTWYYNDTNGSHVTGWFKDGSNWYYTNSNGAMQTGWLHLGNTWYYLKSSGAMATGWQKVGEVWYYFHTSGAMATGWIRDGGSWYYMTSSGTMATGWLKDGNTWYYMKPNGVMATGWVQDGNNWYYMDASGAMLRDTYVGSYHLNSSGVWDNR